jgi:predicted glutamine amidotransferase
MCRLFGFRSIITSQVHSSLIHAENALMDQSLKHPDGWGLAYYIENTPHLIRSSITAMDDHIFEKVSGVVSSQTVMAHIRNATQGDHNILNTHPFQYGPWVFAHNGNIKNFDKIKKQLIDRVSPKLKRFILGNTDSEIIFFLILTFIQDKFDLDKKDVAFDEIKTPIEEALLFITGLTGPLLNQNETIPTENYLSFLMTNGITFVGFQGGQSIKYCTHKSKCPERDTCTFFDAGKCETKSNNGSLINHLILTSEEIKGVNVWTDLKPGELVGIDHGMRFHIDQLNIKFVDKVK